MTLLARLYVELVREHRRVVAEYSGNFGGHVGIREGWVPWDEDTLTEACHCCDLLEEARKASINEEE